MKILLKMSHIKVRIICFACVQMFFWIISGNLSYAHHNYSRFEQDILAQKVSLNMQSVQMKKVLFELERQTNVKFVFSNYTVKSVNRVSLNASNESLSTVLYKLFTPLSISYSIVGSRILLRKIDNKTGAVEGAVKPILTANSVRKMQIITRVFSSSHKAI